MRILIITLLLIVCARSVAQTTLITKGEIRLGIEVFDYANDRQLDISTLCDRFDEDGVPLNLVIPYQSQIKLFLPDVTEENAKPYKYAFDGSKTKNIKNFNYEYDGQNVAFFGSKSYSGGSVDAIEIVKIENIVTFAMSQPSVLLRWAVDKYPLELDAFIQNDEIDERQQWNDSIWSNIFSNQPEKDYSYWIEKGFAKTLSEKGLPENPVFPIGSGMLSFSANTTNVVLLRDGEEIPFNRIEEDFQEYYSYYFKPEKSGSYVLKLSNPNIVYGPTVLNYNFSVPFSFWQEGGQWMVAIIGVLLIAFIGYRYTTKRKLKQTNLLKQLSDAELKAIRSQLNPHFLFNALSAIQNLVNQNKNDLANDYIVKLSKLLRRVLVQSDESLHSLGEELELAELYLELEKLRIPFEYKVHVSDDIDRNILVPSMILQPYLENAVFHGVSKFGASNVELHVDQNGMQLRCVIRDNAPHTDKSFTEGKGMSMGRERIDILRKQVGDEIKADIETHKGHDGFRVDINLPLNL